MFLLKNPFFMFLANPIFAVSHLKIHPAVYLNTLEALTSKRKIESIFVHRLQEKIWTQ